LQLGAVCVGLWEGNCAKVVLGISIFKQKGGKKMIIKIIIALIIYDTIKYYLKKLL